MSHLFSWTWLKPRNQSQQWVTKACPQFVPVNLALTQVILLILTLIVLAVNLIWAHVVWGESGNFSRLMSSTGELDGMSLSAAALVVLLYAGTLPPLPFLTAALSHPNRDNYCEPQLSSGSQWQLSGASTFQEKSDVCCDQTHTSALHLENILNVFVGFYRVVGGKGLIVRPRALLSKAVSSCPVLKDNWLLIQSGNCTAPLWLNLFMFDAFFVALSVKWDLNDPSKHYKLNILENASTAFVFIIVVVNVFITAFGVQRPMQASWSPSQAISAPSDQDLCC